MALAQTKNELDWKTMEYIFDVAYNFVYTVFEEVKNRFEGKITGDIDIIPQIDIINDKVFIKMYFKIDVTDVIGNNRECIYIDDVSENCSSMVYELIKDKDINEDEAEKIHSDCVEQEIEQFVTDYASQPFYFAYSIPPNVIAWLKTEVFDDGGGVCIYDILHVVWKQEVHVNAINMLENENTIEYNANQIVSEIERIIEALETLAGVN